MFFRKLKLKLCLWASRDVNRDLMLLVSAMRGTQKAILAEVDKTADAIKSLERNNERLIAEHSSNEIKLAKLETLV